MMEAREYGLTWCPTRTLPFYVRGLLKAVPVGVLPEVCAIAALTDPEMEVIMITISSSGQEPRHGTIIAQLQGTS